MAKKEAKRDAIVFNLAVDYQVQYPAEQKVDDVDGAYASITKDYIVTAVMMANRDGLDSQYRRLWTKIEAKIESAIASKTYEVTLEQGEYNFIVASFKSEKAKFVPQLAKYVVKLEDALASATF